MCFLTVLEVVKSKIKLSAGLVSPAASLLGLQVATFLLGPHLVFCLGPNVAFALWVYISCISECPNLFIRTLADWIRAHPNSLTLT